MSEFFLVLAIGEEDCILNFLSKFVVGVPPNESPLGLSFSFFIDLFQGAEFMIVQLGLCYFRPQCIIFEYRVIYFL